MGDVNVPEHSYFGAQTQRAIENFNISGMRFPPVFIHSLALIKKYAAKANAKLDLIDSKRGDAIAKAADEVADGQHDSQFPLDVFQTGSGTSTNMNMNEVISARANEILTGEIKVKGQVHPNDHVNLCQSSNDVIPTAIHIAASRLLRNKMIPSLCILRDELNKKADAFSRVYKIGRTHLQDAVIITLGNEFSGYSRQIELGIQRIESVLERLVILALGGTAVGTGLNAHKDFAREVISRIADDTGIPFIESPNHFESQAACDTAVEASGILKTTAVSIIKIANDIRLLSSGPRCGLSEITIPPLQPGSSIMPGKINPVIPEAVIQACSQIIGNDTAITFGGQGGYFELNTMMPLVAHNLLQSIKLMSNSAKLLAEKCVSGITANEKKCRQNIKESLAIVTGLVPYIGYDRAAALAHKAYDEDRSIEDVALAENILPEKQLLDILYGEIK